MDIPSSFLVQISSLFLLYGFTLSLLASSYSVSFQKHRSTCEITLVPVSLLFLLTLLPSLFHSKFPIPLPSSFFCLCYSDFSCFGLHCFSHFSGHLIIFTSLVFQLISGLWHISYNISKITLHF